MIVHGEDETDESDSKSLVREKESSSSQVESVSRGFSGEELPDSWYFICETLLCYFIRGIST